MNPMNLVFKALVAMSVAVLMTSCATQLPEFERVASLEKGEQRLAAGAYAGSTPADARAGAAVFHSTGLSKNVNWSTLASVGGHYVFSSNNQGYLFNSTLVSGPKFRLGESVALTLPVGVNRSFGGQNFPAEGAQPTAIPVATSVLTMPTLYKGFGANQYGDFKHLLFVRGEASFSKQQTYSARTLSVGYKYTNYSSRYNTAYNVNLTYVGAFFGISWDLR